MILDARKEVRGTTRIRPILATSVLTISSTIKPVLISILKLGLFAVRSITKEKLEPAYAIKRVFTIEAMWSLPIFIVFLKSSLDFRLLSVPYISIMEEA